MNMFPSRKISFVIKLIVAFACLTLILQAWFFFQVSLIRFPQADDYRLTILHLMPWIEGGWTFKSLWGDVHPNPVHGIYLISSMAWEDLSFTSLPYVIFPFIVAKWWFYQIAIKESLWLSSTNNFILALLVAIVVFSFNSTMQYRWNSVAIAQIYHAIGGLYLVLLARILNSDSLKGWFFLGIAMLFFQLMARQYALPWFLSTVAVLGLSCLFTQKVTLTFVLKFIAVFSLTLMFEAIFNGLIGIEHNDGNSDSIYSNLEHWFERPPDLIKYLVVAISSPIVNPRFLQLQFGLDENSVLIISFMMSALVVTCVFTCMVNLDKVAYQILLIMFVFSFITIAASTIYRTSEATAWLSGHISRYVSFRDVSTVAVLVVMFLQFLKHRAWQTTLLASLIVMAFMWLQIEYYRFNWVFVKTQDRYVQNNVAELEYLGEYLLSDRDSNVETIHKDYTSASGKKLFTNIGRSGDLSNNQRLQIIYFWRKNKLNIYRD